MANRTLPAVYSPDLLVLLNFALVA